MFGIYSATPAGPFIPGLEYAGKIIKKGKNVVFFEEGQPVIGVTRFGAYASHLNINSNYLTPLPTGWSFAEGAALLVQGITAYYSLINLGNLQQHQTVLIHSAAGGVGLLANRIAKAYNAFTIGTIGSSHKEALLRSEGYNEVLVRDANFNSNLSDIAKNHPLNIVLECIGGKIQEISFDQLAPMGRMVVYGAAQYASPGHRPNYIKMAYQYLTRPKIDPQAMIQRNKSVMAFNLIWLYENFQLMHDIMDEMMQLDIGKPMVGHLFRFDHMHDAISLFQSGQTTGKVIVEVNNESI
jgi:alcohol dehydrogenase